MKIVINTLSLGRGGAERVITNLCNEFLVNIHDITIITYMFGESSYQLNSSINHIYIDEKINQAKQNKVSRFLRRRKKLKKIIKEIKPDIILSFLPEPNFTILSLKKTLNIPIIISVRNDPNKEYSFLPYKILMKILYPKADGYVFQTKEASEYFNFNKKITSTSRIIPNPLSKEFIIQPYNGEREKKIVSVGRFNEQKNHKLLVKAFSKVSNDFKDYSLIIYGEGEMRKELEQTIEELGMKDKIILPGTKYNIKELIYKASLFVLTSDYEGMPNALMEAMALGLPVISTNCPCGGPKSLIKNGKNGLLIKVNCEDELVSAINKLLSNTEYANTLGKEANKIKEKFESQKIYKMWNDYLNLIYSQQSKSGV